MRRLLPEGIYIHRGLAAIRHLGRVAAGLDSLVIGEHEISGQLRRALVDARASGEAGLLIERVIHAALRAGGRVRAETGLAEGALSVAGASVAFAERFLSTLEHRAALVVGAGEVGGTVASLLARRRAAVSIASRSFHHAGDVAARVGGTAVALADVLPTIGLSDAVFVAVRTPGWSIDAAACAAVMRARQSRPLLVLDLSVPRAVARDASRLDGLALFDVDDLGSVRLATERRRLAAVPLAERIVDDEAARAYSQFQVRVQRIRRSAA
jgi:glutamyl-tRNA reductase